MINKSYMGRIVIRLIDQDFFVNKYHHVPKDREYEKSGLYPKNGKPFRLFALLGWLTLSVVIIAGISYALNIILI